MTERGTPIESVLVVDDDPTLLETLRRVLERRPDVTSVPVGTCEEALDALRAARFDLVITDVDLGARSGVEVAAAAGRLHPAPPVIAISGAASLEDAFALGRAGVAAILPKPFKPTELWEAIDQLSPPEPSELDVLVRRIVGATPMPELLEQVRRTMVLEALARTEDNKAQAASLLGISRQHLQKILERGQA